MIVGRAKPLHMHTPKYLLRALSFSSTFDTFLYKHARSLNYWQTVTLHMRAKLQFVHVDKKKHIHTYAQVEQALIHTACHELGHALGLPHHKVTIRMCACIHVRM